MGINCCDCCEDYWISFCQLCETPSGSKEHWEMVNLWNLHGLFPCDYLYPNYLWVQEQRKWFYDQVQRTRIDWITD